MARMVTSAAEILANTPARVERVAGPDRPKVREWAITYGFLDADARYLPPSVVAMYQALHPDGDA